MTEQRVTLDTAKLAKEKGFDIDSCRCGGFPDCICTDKSPTQSLLQKWLREEKAIHIEIYCNASGWGWILTKLNGTSIKQLSDYKFLPDFDSALEIGLQEALN